MEWWLTLGLVFVGLILLMVTGLPVAFSFLMIDIVGAVLVFGGSSGIELLLRNIEESMTNFSLLPVPLFVFMGVILFQSAIYLLHQNVAIVLAKKAVTMCLLRIPLLLVYFLVSLCNAPPHAPDIIISIS